MPNKIHLNKDIFKVLSSDTRVDILKKLDERRMTVTELSKSLGLNKATIHEHLSKMSGAGLVQKRDSTNKWVYYELTGKGREILHPHEVTKIILLLSSAALTFTGGLIGIYMFVKSTFPAEEVPMPLVAPMPISSPTPRSAPKVGLPSYELQYLIVGIILTVFAISLLYLAHRMWKGREA